MKAKKWLHKFFQKSKVTNDDFLKYFDAYAKVIEYYTRRSPEHAILVKSKLTNME